MLALLVPGGVGGSSGLLPRFHTGAPPPGKRLAASPWAARGRWQPEAAMEEPGATFLAPAWPLARPGPQDGLGQGGPRLKWAKGRFWSKIDEKVKVLRMSLPIVENLS